MIAEAETSLLILDTDHVAEFQTGTSADAANLRQRLLDTPSESAITIVCVEEQLRGWLAEIHRQKDVSKQIVAYRRLQNLFAFFSHWRILPWTEDAAERFREQRKNGVRIKTMDLKIACIALVHDATLLTRNRRDFEKVPDLRIENWLY